jgi:hypothetical protein
MEKIKSDLLGNFLWISVDETTDMLGRYVANLLIKKLDGIKILCAKTN